MTSPKKHGELGNKNTKMPDLALFAKHVHNMILENNKLWARVLSPIYLGQWFAAESSNFTNMWHSILKTLEELRKGFKSCIGINSLLFGATII